MDLEKENENLKHELERALELGRCNMDYIDKLRNEVEEANTVCSKLYDVIYEATEELYIALGIEEMDELYNKLQEIKNILEGVE